MTTLRLRFYFKIFVFTLFFFLACGFETSFWPHLIPWIPGPQIWLLMILFFTLKWSPLFTIFYIYFLGFCLTRFSHLPLKMVWSTLLITFSILWLIKNRVQMSGVFSFILFCLGGSFVFQISYIVLSHTIERVPTSIMFTDRLLQILVNFIFSYPLYFILQWCDESLFKKNDWSRSPEKPEMES